MDLRFWTKALREAERELEAAAGNITLKAAAKRYMRAKAQVKPLKAELANPTIESNL